ncbi:MAG: UDP-N-acetylmuramoyl-tripeptide--D-alanyl-D-alanine ligase [Demequina sp.]
MMPVSAQWVANAVGGMLAAEVDVQVTSVEKDSRDVSPGALYVAFVGEHVDGHDFVPQAMQAGAVVALVSQPVNAPHIMVDDVTAALGKLARAYLAHLRLQGQLTVIGITGSNGKTTTKDLLAQMLPAVVAPVGSFNNEIGLPLTVLRADSSTRHLVMEMGASAPGDIEYLTSIAPLDIAVVLVVGSAHLGSYSSMDALAAEKATLLDGLLPGGAAVLNADDARVAAMARRAGLAESGARVRMFGSVGDGVDVAASQVGLRRGCPSFALHLGDTDAPVALRLVGEHHLTNALAAAATALECGMALPEVATALSQARALSGHRMAVTDRPDGVTVIDDSYNASPESMRAALRALLAVAEGGRTVAVLGEMLEMGDMSLKEHLDIGHDVVRLGIDQLVVVGPGAKAIHESAVREGSWGDEAVYVATIGEAHHHLEEYLAAGDTVLVKASQGAGLWKLADQLVGVNE